MESKAFIDLAANANRKEDSRGYLEVLYENNGTILKRSFSRKGVFRGMHRQASPFMQEKIIRVVKGVIIDFVIDMNRKPFLIESKTLTPESDWVHISGNYAHGFYAVEDTVFEYICDGEYNESSEEALSIVDYLKSEMGLGELILSEKDLAALPLTL